MHVKVCKNNVTFKMYFKSAKFLGTAFRNPGAEQNESCFLSLRFTANGCRHLRQRWRRLRRHVGIQRASERNVSRRTLLRGELASYSGCRPLFISLYTHYARPDFAVCSGRLSSSDSVKPFYKPFYNDK